MESLVAYYGQTNVHPLALSAVLILGLTTLALHRRLALVPLFFAATSLPMSQRIAFLGADFTLMRILLLLGLLRIIFKKEYNGFNWGRLDSVVILWAVSSTTIMTLSHGTVDAFINRLGFSYDLLLTYFLTRVIVNSWDVVQSHARAVAYISVPISLLFFYESQTQYNLFSVFGGVNEFTWVREGRLRCQGPFEHPILAGTFWAACLPVLWHLRTCGKNDRRLGSVGIICALVIVVACGSSTPVMSVAAFAFAMALFPFRAKRRLMWVSALIGIACLHLFIMKTPVWHLLARVDVIGGSTGWHRFVVFDAFVRNFSNWYLLGDTNVAAWGVWQMRDITNQYVLVGVLGGLVTLAFFLLTLVYCFGNVGRALTSMETDAAKIRSYQLRVWLIGVAMFVHVVTFFGVSYFGQMITILYIQIGLAGFLGAMVETERQEHGNARCVRDVRYHSRIRSSLVRRPP
jgi:hypothetical protein